MSSPSSLMDTKHPRIFSPEEQEQKKLFYEKMSPRRRKFIDKVGFENWDPFEAPKDPMDIRVDSTNRTIQQLIEDFLQSSYAENSTDEYRQGALESAFGLVNQAEKQRGIFDFCLWYHDLLQKREQ